MTRLNNRSIVIEQKGKTYSVDPEVLETLKMDRTELFRSHLADTQKISSLKSKAANEDRELSKAKAKAQEEAIYAKAKEAAMKELKGNGNG